MLALPKQDRRIATDSETAALTNFPLLSHLYTSLPPNRFLPTPTRLYYP